MKLKSCFAVFRPSKVDVGDVCTVAVWPKISWELITHRFEALECDFKLSLNEFSMGKIISVKG